MGMGVVKYCTAEGGSGYIANPALPWLSGYDITQQSPVYDQTTGWLRDSKPGSFTYYPRFGPPYSADGGVLPPYPGDGLDSQPAPSSVGCGMGAVDSPQVLLRSDVVAPMPSITIAARDACGQLVSNCPTAAESWIESNPWLAIGLALVAGALVFGGTK